MEDLVAHIDAPRLIKVAVTVTFVKPIVLADIFPVHCWILRVPQRVHPHDPGVDIASISGPRVCLHTCPILFHLSAHMTGLSPF